MAHPDDPPTTVTISVPLPPRATMGGPEVSLARREADSILAALEPDYLPRGMRWDLQDTAATDDTDAGRALVLTAELR